MGCGHRACAAGRGGYVSRETVPPLNHAQRGSVTRKTRASLCQRSRNRSAARRLRPPVNADPSAWVGQASTRGRAPPRGEVGRLTFPSATQHVAVIEAWPTTRQLRTLGVSVSQPRRDPPHRRPPSPPLRIVIGRILGDDDSRTSDCLSIHSDSPGSRAKAGAGARSFRRQLPPRR